MNADLAKTIELATGLMGWKQVFGNPVHPGHFVTMGDAICVNLEETGFRYWQPFTNRADAMEVLEKCAEMRSGDVLICKMVDGWGVATRFVGSEVQAKTLPEAICNFALTETTP